MDRIAFCITNVGSRNIVEFNIKCHMERLIQMYELKHNRYDDNG